MDHPQDVAPEPDRLDFHAFLGAGSDFDVVGLRRSATPAGVVVLDPVAESEHAAGAAS
jgi:hypothetical protein